MIMPVIGRLTSEEQRCSNQGFRPLAAALRENGRSPFPRLRGRERILLSMSKGRCGLKPWLCRGEELFEVISCEEERKKNEAPDNGIDSNLFTDYPVYDKCYFISACPKTAYGASKSAGDLGNNHNKRSTRSHWNTRDSRVFWDDWNHWVGWNCGIHTHRNQCTHFGWNCGIHTHRNQCTYFGWNCGIHTHRL